MQCSECYLLDGVPLEGVVLADDGVGHTDKALAELLDAVPAVVGGVRTGLCGDVGSQRQQLDERHHISWLQALLLSVLQGLDRHIQQGRRLSQAAQTRRLLPKHRRLKVETDTGLKQVNVNISVWIVVQHYSVILKYLLL